MKVGIIMGSKSDWPTMKLAADMLDQFGVPYETKVVSAHRTPQLLADYASGAKERGIKVIMQAQVVQPTYQVWRRRLLVCQCLGFPFSLVH